MAKENNMYIANLSFFLNYGDGTKNDEIESEIFKVGFQSKESVHYDRAKGAGFQDLEQDQANIATGLKFIASLIESVYRVNEEKNFNPYIVLGFSDISINNDVAGKTGEYVAEVKYRLLRDISVSGNIRL
jgi:hypothetical protein